MIIIKNNMVFVLIYLVLMVNLARAEGNAFEPASQFYCDKVHEFLGYLGVENAVDVGVYKIGVQEGEKRDYLIQSTFHIRTGFRSEIWINENMRVDNPLIKTEQDVIWRLAMAAVNYASGLSPFFLTDIREHLKKDCISMVQMLCEHGYQDAAQAFVNYADMYLN